MIPRWMDPFTPEGQRAVVAKVLAGTNYRLSYEHLTRATLIERYAELTKIARRHPSDDAQWRREIQELLADPRKGDLRAWLLGLTRKTAQNLGVKVKDYPSVFEQLMDELQAAPQEPRETALLLWCGAATLTVRGSQKARIGKRLERSLVRASLTAIGLTEGTNFWLDIQADQEVGRQTDAEVATARGRVRLEVGLIGIGNPEVIGDKVGRLDRNGVILFDMLPPRSTMWQTAEQSGVKLIQLRNNNAVEELRQHLATLNVGVRAEPVSVTSVEEMILSLSLTVFE